MRKRSCGEFVFSPVPIYFVEPNVKTYAELVSTKLQVLDIPTATFRVIPENVEKLLEPLYTGNTFHVIIVRGIDEVNQTVCFIAANVRDTSLTPAFETITLQQAADFIFEQNQIGTEKLSPVKRKRTQPRAVVAPTPTPPTLKFNLNVRKLSDTITPTTTTTSSQQNDTQKSSQAPNATQPLVPLQGSQDVGAPPSYVNALSAPSVSTPSPQLAVPTTTLAAAAQLPNQSPSPVPPAPIMTPPTATPNVLASAEEEEKLTGILTELLTCLQKEDENSLPPEITEELLTVLKQHAGMVLPGNIAALLDEQLAAHQTASPFQQRHQQPSGLSSPHSASPTSGSAVLLPFQPNSPEPPPPAPINPDIQPRARVLFDSGTSSPPPQPQPPSIPDGPPLLLPSGSVRPKPISVGNGSLPQPTATPPSTPTDVPPGLGGKSSTGSNGGMYNPAATIATHASSQLDTETLTQKLKNAKTASEAHQKPPQSRTTNINKGLINLKKMLEQQPSNAKKPTQEPNTPTTPSSSGKSALSIAGILKSLQTSKRA
eukprot:TRINITY_DN21581_c0_g1_i1.p1 TRINITY_DN21581_c0_g1~~TRINITY_DN21581_c0_g1_i1.p1  ORF type:complete len:542 (-),score=51.22 TRINITY_DN21581_c0_g1_i1:57-1682(-)